MDSLFSRRALMCSDQGSSLGAVRQGGIVDQLINAVVDFSKFPYSLAYRFGRKWHERRDIGPLKRLPKLPLGS